LIVTVLVALVLASCASAHPQAAAKASPPAMGDVDIRVPSGLERHPALRAAVEDVVARERREYATAAASSDAAESSAWQLALNYRILVGNARLRVAEGNGHVMTGGAHGAPIIERQVYDVERDRVLRIGDWFDNAEVWPVIATRVRAALPAHLHAQDDADARQWVFKGTPPEPTAFALYEPLFSPEGPVLFFRFHFPPYRVAPYSAGPQQVDVPIELLEPFVRKDARALLSARAMSD
jgi:hypothetical protein